MVSKSNAPKASRASGKAASKSKARKAGKAAPQASPSMDALRSYVRMHAAELLADPNITSVGVGYKQSAGRVTPQLCIQFTVGAKVAPERLEALGSRPIPPAIEVDGMPVPTDVIERSYQPGYRPVTLEPKDRRKARADVLQAGMSVGSVHTTAGTIGAFVRDRLDHQIVLLSNWHVLQGPEGAIGTAIVQPGPHDDNRIELNQVGSLLRSHLGAAGDCAIASISAASGRSLSGEVLGLGVSIASIGDPELGDRVVKSGRTTGVTQGIVARVEVNTRLNYGGGIMAVVGGFEIVPDPAAPAPEGEISRGGDSGSAWLAVDAKGKPSGVMLGLHFAGNADGSAEEVALACYAESVMTALEVEPAGDLGAVPAVQADAAAARSGFDRGFLPFLVDAPQFSSARSKELALLDGSAELRYCHFSVWLSKVRKYPLCVAWNIDGDRFKRLGRVAFKTDTRGELAQYQLGDALYVRNPFDRGHIARRADVCWGDLAQARQANHDSFYYTNIVPQHEAFNQSGHTGDDPDGGLWGRLENTVFDSQAPHRLRVSVMGGPVFGREDRRFAQNGLECLVPDEFWKVVAYVDDADGNEKAYAFLLTQRHLVEPLTSQRLDLEPWLWARIGLADLERKTGVRFAKALHQREVPFTAPQSLLEGPALKLLASPAEYFA